MTTDDCTRVTERLDELFDDSVAGPGVAELRRHVAACADCGRRLADAAVLSQAAQELPREIAPECDLWPAIGAEIERAIVVRDHFGGAVLRRWRPWAVAAAAVLALVVAYQLGRRAATQPAASQTVAIRATMDEPIDGMPDASARAGYRQARDELLAALDLRREALSPETLAVVDRNLAVIEHSIEGIRTALEADPGNPRLVRRLGFIYRQQLDLLRRAVTIPTSDELARPARS